MLAVFLPVGRPEVLFALVKRLHQEVSGLLGVLQPGPVVLHLRNRRLTVKTLVSWEQ